MTAMAKIRATALPIPRGIKNTSCVSLHIIRDENLMLKFSIIFNDL
jgi:hypothetical protein